MNRDRDKNWLTTSKALRREEHTKTNTHHMKRGEEVFEEIDSRMQEYAKQYGLSIEQLRDLLTDPERWNKFLEMRKLKKDPDPKDAPNLWELYNIPVPPEQALRKGPLVEEKSTSVKSRATGNRVNTSDFPIGFKYFALFKKDLDKKDKKK